VADPVFLTLAEVIEVHVDQIRRYGGQAGLRDLGLLQSALAQPQASFAGQWLHNDLYAMAGAYTYHSVKITHLLTATNEPPLPPLWCFLNLTGSACWTHEAD